MTESKNSRDTIHRQCTTCKQVKALYKNFDRVRVKQVVVAFTDDCKVCRKAAHEAEQAAASQAEPKHDPAIWPWKYNGKVYNDDTSSIL